MDARRNLARAIVTACLAGAVLAARDPLAAPSAAPHQVPFEIASNKPWVQVRLNGSEPQWFILDSGASLGSVIAKECADRLGLAHGDETVAHMGAGAGVSVGVSRASGVALQVGSDTLDMPGLVVFPLAHVSPFEGRRLDGLLGRDFLGRHVVVIDYAKRMLQVLDPASYAPPRGAIVVPIDLGTGLAVAKGSIQPAGSAPIACRFVIDTGVRTTIILYHPFSVAHHLLDSGGKAITATTGGGAGGETRGDLARLDRLSIGALSIERPTAFYSRDTVGVFADPNIDGIVGGEILRRCRVTFDYPHLRLVLEPEPEAAAPYESDMSGLFLVSPGPDFRRVTVFTVAERTPAAESGLRKGDEIVEIDGRSAASIGLEAVRGLLRKPAKYHLRVARGDGTVELDLTTRRLV